MSNVKDVGTAIFSGIWDLCLHTEFPGLDVSIAAVIVALLLIRLSIKVFGYLTGFGMSGSDYGRAASTAEKYKNDRTQYIKTMGRPGKKSKFNWEWSLGGKF